MQRWKALALAGVVAILCAACGNSGIPNGVIVNTPALVPKLIHTSDFPGGWSKDQSFFDGEATGASPSCLSGAANLDSAVQHAAVAYQAQSSLPLFFESLGLFKSGKSLGVISKVADILNSCRHFSFTVNGQSFRAQVGSLNFPQVGNASSSLSVVFKGQVISFVCNIVLVSTGDYGVTLGMFQLGSINATQFEDLVEAALQRLST